MITINSIRHNGDEYHYPERSETRLAALNKLVEFELGYGGSVVDLTKTKVVVQTRVLNCVDITTFEGSEDDMRPLVEVAGYYMMVSQGEANEQIISAVVEKLGTPPHQVGMFRPLYLQGMAPLMIGASRVKAACLMSMGVAVEADAEIGLAIATKDLIALLELFHESPGASFRDLAELAA